MLSEKPISLLQDKDIAATGHEWDTNWSKNDTQHWIDCLNDCGEKYGETAHTWNDGTVTKQPTADVEEEKNF